MATTHTTSPLLKLPGELLHQILRNLPAASLGQLAQTCRALHARAHDDLLWKALVEAVLPAGYIDSIPDPKPNFRTLYLSHYPHWFLLKYRFWYSDEWDRGCLAVSAYNPASNTITLYPVFVRIASPPQPLHWPVEQGASIYSFSPSVERADHMPILSLAPQPLGPFSPFIPDGPTRRFMFTRPLPPNRLTPSPFTMLIIPRDILWPPYSMPTAERTRILCDSSYVSPGHTPRNARQVSTRTFRIKETEPPIPGFEEAFKFITWAALDEDALRPTERHPWRGLWAGDYQGHGPEFVAFLQPEAPWEMMIPPDALKATSDERDISELLLYDEYEDAYDESGWSEGDNLKEGEPVCEGPLVGVKLTGDENVPAGGIAFIAPDIGSGGTARRAWEPPFNGARVVRSTVQHVVTETNDYDMSQLFLVDQDVIAQWYCEWGHFSFYRRVHMEQLLERWDKEGREEVK
ncbi:hypothetical protein EJ06DRAFT_310524 [Trichodelitschia bisporula]|uniref:F-box domain-containing protein n=1 Tax=Trichodelitschia bisporula TaxID=703511 RepID=A0A6G1I450_9PEZI|nr:hypothetical protein EJ06DRAFT_310524 [Trichodelitschia bisporula]